MTNILKLTPMVLLVGFISACNQQPAQDRALNDPLAAGWKGESVCEVLYEDQKQRALRCTFPPGVGHEEHYHIPHFGYALSGGKMRITDETGTREADILAGSSFKSEGTLRHKGLNVGETTVAYIIFEVK